MSKITNELRKEGDRIISKIREQGSRTSDKGKTETKEKRTQTRPVTDENLIREIGGIIRTDDNVDYDELSDPDQKAQYNAKIDGLERNMEYLKNLEQCETDPHTKIIYKSARELCELKKSQIELRVGLRPASEEVLSIIREETQRDDVVRFEKRGGKGARVVGQFVGQISPSYRRNPKYLSSGTHVRSEGLRVLI